jgi:hypothetical protein
MIPSIVVQNLQGLIKEIQAPTPYARGEILPVAGYKQSLFSAGFSKMRAQLVTSYRPVDYTPLLAVTSNSATTQILDTPRLITWRNKGYNTSTPITAMQVEACMEYQDFSMFTDIGTSAIEGWDAMVEGTAVKGITIDQIPGILNASGIPQATETANFFNGSMTGSQMVDILLFWASAVKRTTFYRYSTKVMALPSKLYLQLNQSTFAIAGSTTDRSVLSVLLERLKNIDPEYRIVESPIQDFSKFILLCPFDPEQIGLGLVPLRVQIRKNGEVIDHNAAIMGCVAQHSESGLVIRLPNMN